MYRDIKIVIFMFLRKNAFGPRLEMDVVWIAIRMHTAGTGLQTENRVHYKRI